MTKTNVIPFPDPMKFYDCGGCGHYHPVNWNGDCRDDANRFTADDLDDKYGDRWTEVAQPGDFDSYIERIEDEHGIIITDRDRYWPRYIEGCPAGAAVSMWDGTDLNQLCLPLGRA